MLQMLYIDFWGPWFTSFLQNYLIPVHVQVKKLNTETANSQVQKLNTCIANSRKLKLNCTHLSSYNTVFHNIFIPFIPIIISPYHVHITILITLQNYFSLAKVIFISELFSMNTMSCKRVQPVPFSAFLTVLSTYKTVTHSSFHHDIKTCTLNDNRHWTQKDSTSLVCYASK